MTTTEQIQALQNAINALQTQLNNVSAQLSTTSNSLNLHLVDCVADINTITGRLAVLANEDTEIHQEIHDVAEQVDSNTSRINNLEIADVAFDTRIDNLEEADTDFQQQLDDMDLEHHEELHTLAMAIDNAGTRINQLEIFKAETPEHVVLTEDEYEALGNPDFDTFYFTYEED